MVMTTAQETGFFALAAVCGIVLLAALLRKRAQFALNFCVRAALGAIVTVFVNDLLEKQGIDVSVGLNAVSLLTAGSLGFPGVALLYGISATKFL